MSEKQREGKAASNVGQMVAAVSMETPFTAVSDIISIERGGNGRREGLQRD